MQRGAWSITNVLTHVVVPLAAIADFFLIAGHGTWKKRDVLWGLIPPLAYVVYAGIGYARGWEFVRGVRYPYFFLNWGSPAGVFGFSDSLPFLGCGWWILILLLLLVAVGEAYLALAAALARCRSDENKTNSNT